MGKKLQYYKDICRELETIFEMVFDQITVADKNGVFIRVSNSCGENFGLPNKEIIGRSAYELEDEGVFNNSSTVAVLKEKREVSLVQVTKAKKKLLVTGKPIFDKEGNISRVINISRDITEIENLRQELKMQQALVKMVQQQLLVQSGNHEILVGCTKKMQEVVSLMQHVAPLQTTILLLGETGVGKSMFARYIHNCGIRKGNPFVQINCGAIPSDLLESELFGYSPGAFTGAIKNGKKGLLESAGDGTVFLDEISELPLHLQVKLLHVLHEKECTRLGDTKPIKIEARIIAAANKDLKKLVEKGRFREDLYYRISVVPIQIPPLRDRKEDIIRFIRLFMNKMSQRYGIVKDITYDATEILKKYDWPGNVREMENVIERLVVSTFVDTITADHVTNSLSSQMFSSEKINEGRTSTEINNRLTLKDQMNDFEKDILVAAKKLYSTTRSMAEHLNVDQSTIVKKMKKYNIEN